MCEIDYAFSLRTGRFWRCEAGGVLAVRTGPWARGTRRVRVCARVRVGRPAGARRLTLRPEQVDEEGLLFVRLPEAWAGCLAAIRVWADGRVGGPRMVYVAPRA